MMILHLMWRLYLSHECQLTDMNKYYIISNQCAYSILLLQVAIKDHTWKLRNYVNIHNKWLWVKGYYQTSGNSFAWLLLFEIILIVSAILNTVTILLTYFFSHCLSSYGQTHWMEQHSLPQCCIFDTNRLFVEIKRNEKFSHLCSLSE